VNREANISAESFLAGFGWLHMEVAVHGPWLQPSTVQQAKDGDKGDKKACNSCVI
jgi:hypothetical protein